MGGGIVLAILGAAGALGPTMQFAYAAGKWWPLSAGIAGVAMIATLLASARSRAAGDKRAQFWIALGMAAGAMLIALAAWRLTTGVRFGDATLINAAGLLLASAAWRWVTPKL
jgi:hypothetical protein